MQITKNVLSNIIFTISIFTSSKDNTHEKDINMFLHEEKIYDFFTKDEVLFFKFLFTEQLGFNLRNKVAHSLMYEQEYGFDLMNLLIMALLRIGKYTFNEE